MQRRLSYFSVILKRTCSLISNPLWKSLGAVLTTAVKNAYDGCPAVITQHLQDAWIGETREGFGEFEAWRKDVLRADKTEGFFFPAPYVFIYTYAVRMCKIDKNYFAKTESIKQWLRQEGNKPCIWTRERQGKLLLGPSCMLSNNCEVEYNGYVIRSQCSLGTCDVASGLSVAHWVHLPLMALLVRDKS